jgi:integrase
VERVARHTEVLRSGARVQPFVVAQGWDIEEVSARLGHADVGTTQRTYVHAFDAARRSSERRSRLAALYGRSEPDKPPASSSLANLREAEA